MFGLDYSPDVDDTLLVLDIEDYAALDEQIFNEINSIRADASGYIALLNSIKGNFDGNTYKERGKVSYETEEGVTAVDEAIAYLTGLTAMDPLFREEGMNFACKDHVEDTGLSGTFGNTGTDDSTVEDRVDKYGLALNPSQSNAYGKVTAQDVLLRMIIDDGNAERSNRLNIFISTNNNTGIHSGIHNVTGHMSCVTFAEKYDDNVDDS
jgi:uncharacterized protein YkwD